MAGLFGIMAMYLFLKGKTTTLKPIKTIYYIICCICGILAIGSKENAVMLPIVILLYDFLLIQGVTKKSLKRYSFFFLIAVLVCSALALLIAGPSVFNPKNLIAGYQNRGFSLSERLLTEPRIIIFYISLLLYPMPNRLCLEHDITLSTNLLTPISTIISILTIVLILCVAVTYNRKRPFILFCILFFFMNHLIESSVFPLELIFEHRNYFPSMLFFVPLTLLLSMGLSHFTNKTFFQFLLAAFIIFTLIGWGHSTFVRNAVWRAHKTLLLDCVGKYPDLGRPHHNLGAYYEQMNMLEKAVPEYFTALNKENRNNLVARNWTYYDLGAIYQGVHQDEKALYYYNQAQKYQPHFAPTHVGKGLLFMRQGLYDRAQSSFQKAVEADPENASAYGNIGFLHLLRGNIKEAIVSLKMATMKDPENAKALRHLGIAYKLNGNTGKAFLQFKKSSSLDPVDPFTLLNLANIYDENGMMIQKDETVAQFLAALEKKNITMQKFTKSLASKPGMEDFLATHRKNLLKIVEDAMTKQHLQKKEITRPN